MKTIISIAVILSFIIVPLTGFSIIFLKKDERGYYHYTCEEPPGQVISVKMIHKNTYKVLGTYVGRVVSAKSEDKAAQIACGEAKKKLPAFK